MTKIRIQMKEHFSRMPQKVDVAIAVVIRDTMKAILETMIDSMLSGKSGRYYWRPGPRLHHASAPGETPAVDFGYLRKSYKATMISALTGIVWTPMRKAVILEYGGVAIGAKHYIAPRPHLAPYTLRQRNNFQRDVKEAIQKNARP